jgi:chromatin segregation and condensation protein Rec8/ScpA/Scc1 (kleisin family)
MTAPGCILQRFLDCTGAPELSERKRYWVDNTPNCINKYVPNNDRKEHRKIWDISNKDKLKAAQKKFRILHLEEVRRIDRLRSAEKRLKASLI